jgi:hypothetical protein
MYAVRLLNLITPSNDNRTVFTTEVDSGLAIDDVVYVYGGIFDNTTKLVCASPVSGNANSLANLFIKSKGTQGYKVTAVDTQFNRITLDIPFNGQTNLVSNDPNEMCYVAKSRFVSGKLKKTTWNGGIFGAKEFDAKYAQLGTPNDKAALTWNNGAFAGGWLHRGTWNSSTLASKTTIRYKLVNGQIVKDLSVGNNVDSFGYNTWLSGTFGYSAISAVDVTWNNGYFLGGTWKHGTFVNGHMSSTSKRTVWKDGINKNGTFRDVIWEYGLFENGKWNTFGGIKVSNMSYDRANNSIILTIDDAHKHKISMFKASDYAQLSSITLKQDGSPASYIHKHQGYISAADIRSNSISIPFTFEGKSMPDIADLNFSNAYVSFSSISNITIKNGEFIGPVISNDANRIWENGICKSVIWTGGAFVGQMVSDVAHGRSYWLNGTFNGSLMENVYWVTGTANTGNKYNLHWEDGIHAGGEIHNSYWIKGTFNAGKFLGGTWVAGDFNGASSIMQGTDESNVRWKGGKFNNGTGSYILWENGEFFNGTMTNSYWDSGDFRNGTIKSSYWDYGVFHNGTFDGGTWKTGTFNNGEFKNATWNGGNFYNGIMSASIWNAGTWYYGSIQNGSKWVNGTWRDGTFQGNSEWVNGLWKNGTFHGSTWKDGTWFDGILTNASTFTKGRFLEGEIYGSTIGASSDNAPHEAIVVSTRNDMFTGGATFKPSSVWYKNLNTVNSAITLSEPFDIYIVGTPTDSYTYNINYFPATTNKYERLQAMDIRSGDFVTVLVYEGGNETTNLHTPVLKLTTKLGDTEKAEFTRATDAQTYLGNLIISKTNQSYFNNQTVNKKVRLLAYRDVLSQTTYYSILDLVPDNTVNLGNAVKYILKIKVENKYSVSKPITIDTLTEKTQTTGAITNVNGTINTSIPSKLLDIEGSPNDGIYAMPVYLKTTRNTNQIYYTLRDTADFIRKTPFDTKTMPKYMSTFKLYARVKYSNVRIYNDDHYAKVEIQFTSSFDVNGPMFETQPVKIRKDGELAFPTTVKANLNMTRDWSDEYGSGSTASTESATFEIRQMSGNSVVIGESVLISSRNFSVETQEDTYYDIDLLSINDEIEPRPSITTGTITYPGGSGPTDPMYLDTPINRVIEEA